MNFHIDIHLKCNNVTIENIIFHEIFQKNVIILIRIRNIFQKIKISVIEGSHNELLVLTFYLIN